MMNNLLWLFPDFANSFPKLNKIRNQVLALEGIQAYETSDKAVKIFNPVFFFKEFEEGNSRKMEVEI